MRTYTKDIDKAKIALEKAFELAETIPSRFKGMSPERVIAHLRKTRTKLWKRKIDSRSRH